ncbi:MAG: nucleotide exchange factor GrpE [Candidatus Caenarcaniphilales bacterium]|nr:nucleotide exchange factor GrpE [Candidatus Caenarcaniphilales bacterium]
MSNGNNSATSDSFNSSFNNSSNNSGGTEELISDNSFNEQDELASKCAELENRVKELEDQLKRSVADYQNLLRRSQQEREQTRLYAAEPALTTLIPSLDNFYYALKSFNSESSSQVLLDSLKMIWTGLIASLEQSGFKIIDNAGNIFDPATQEAVTQIVQENVKEGTVLEVFRLGYSLNGKVLKPAQVSVSQNPKK